ncbi:MAG: hypothetical protein NT131_07655 [Methanomassiliicoccales archaeon]|nr:hypothetical protein [Methanomassiliicoccales archaeon]
MALSELFELEEVRLVERSVEDLTNESLLVHMLSGSNEVRLLVDDEETPLAMAREDDGWKAVSFLWKEPSDELIEALPELDIKVFMCTKGIYREAIFDHFCRSLMNECQPAIEDLPEDRVKKVSDLIWKEWSFKPGDLCYDCCCGSGVGSLALTKVGLSSFAFDMDKELLCRGLSEGRLQTWSTVQLDASKASEYLDRVPFAIMLMAGDINTVNAWTWQRIFEQVLLLADKVLVTVASEEEAELLRKWSEGKGRACRVFENPRDAFYDRWVCSIS